MQHITPKRRSSTLRTLLTFEDNRRASEMRLKESKPAKKKTEAWKIFEIVKSGFLQKSLLSYILHNDFSLSWPHRDCRNRTCMTIKVSTSFNNVPNVILFCHWNDPQIATALSSTFPPASSKVVSISIGPAISSTMLKSQPPHKAPSENPTFPKRCPMRVGNFPRSEHKSPSGSSSEVMIIPPKVNHSSRLLKGSHCGSTIQPACQGYARYQSPFPFLTWLIEENCTSGLNSLRIAATDFEVVITLGQKSQKKTPELKTSQIVLIRIQLKESF